MGIEDAIDREYDNVKWIEYLEGVVMQAENALRELGIDASSRRNLSPLVDLM